MTSIIAGTILASTGYSSAGAFSVASGCVGVIGTLLVEERFKQ